MNLKMWKAINPLNYLIYKQDNNLTTELYFKLNLNKDKSKQIDIQISPNSTIKDVFENFRQQIESNAIKIDPEVQEYKFILKDKSNKYNEFVLKNNILLYNYMHEEKYELYYLPFYKKKSYTISVALKDKNSLKHVEKRENYDYTPLPEQLIKTDKAFTYSDKNKQFIPVTVNLKRDIVEIEYSRYNKIIVPLSSISDIKEIKDIKFREGYSIMMITSIYNSKVEKYVLAFISKCFDNWFLLIFNQLHQFLDTFTFMKFCDELTDLNKKKTSFIIQLVNKFSNIKGILSLNFSKKIFFEFYDNDKIKELYDSLIQLRDDILNKKKLVEEKGLIDKIIDIIENDEKLKENNNIIDVLKQNLDKINNLSNDDKNEIINNEIVINNEVKNDENKFIKEGSIYPFIDNLIINYFEPFFNKLMDSKSKMKLMNKIMDFLMKNLHKEDNQFFDFNSDIKELIITN